MGLDQAVRFSGDELITVIGTTSRLECVHHFSRSAHCAGTRVLGLG